MRGVEDVRGGEDSGGQRRALILGLAVVCCAGPACFYHPQGSPDATDASTSAPGTGTASTSSSGDTDGSGTGVTSGAPLPEPPAATSLQLAFSQVKQFEFSWPAAAGATYYQLLERLPGAADHVQLGGDLVGESASLTMPLHLRFGASYLLRACNDAGCTDSAPVDVVDSMAAAVGYFKASNTGPYDYFGLRLALSADGDTLAVGARGEQSASTGVDGPQGNDQADGAGAVYVFVRSNGVWSQQAYIKASNTDAGDYFGDSVALSADGDTLAVGAPSEDSAATGIDGDQADESAGSAGAVYVFSRTGAEWSQQAYVKASNTGAADYFGEQVALSADGDTLAVGAPGEDSASGGIDGDQADGSASSAGAVYVFVRAQAAWSQQAYIKASDPDADDDFGESLALSADGDTLAVGAGDEDGGDGTEADNSVVNAGAVYVFARANDNWSQQAYVKSTAPAEIETFGRALALASDGRTLAVGTATEAVHVFVRPDSDWSHQGLVQADVPGADLFGWSVALSADGDVLAVGAQEEDGAARGINGPQRDESTDAGAAYVFVREGGAWSQRAYVKASNTATGEGGKGDFFGTAVALSADGGTLAVGAPEEDSAAIDIGGNADNDSAPGSGAVYLY